MRCGQSPPLLARILPRQRMCRSDLLQVMMMLLLLQKLLMGMLLLRLLQVMMRRGPPQGACRRRVSVHGKHVVGTGVRR